MYTTAALQAWWPGMNKQVEEQIQRCHSCQFVSSSPQPEPVKPTTLSQEPLSKLAIDICGPFPTGEQFAVLTDYYSKCAEIKVFQSVTSKNILNWLLLVFATHRFSDKIQFCFIFHFHRIQRPTGGLETNIRQ